MVRVWNQLRFQRNDREGKWVGTPTNYAKACWKARSLNGEQISWLAGQVRARNQSAPSFCSSGTTYCRHTSPKYIVWSGISWVCRTGTVIPVAPQTSWTVKLRWCCAVTQSLLSACTLAWQVVRSGGRDASRGCARTAMTSDTRTILSKETWKWSEIPCESAVTAQTNAHAVPTPMPMLSQPQCPMLLMLLNFFFFNRCIVDKRPETQFCQFCFFTELSRKLSSLAISLCRSWSASGLLKTIGN